MLVQVRHCGVVVRLSCKRPPQQTAARKQALSIVRQSRRMELAIDAPKTNSDDIGQIAQKVVAVVRCRTTAA